ncbi:MAG: hypothetical protein ACPLRM_09035, partial [Anaerolineae bacterium]
PHGRAPNVGAYGHTPLRDYPLAAAYIRWGERQGYHQRPTCASRTPWWDVGYRTPANFVWPMIHNDRMIVGVHDPRIQVDHNLFEVTGSGEILLAAIVISSPQAIVRELFGRSNLGEGALKTEGVDIVRLLVLRPSAMSEPQQKAMLSAFNRVAHIPLRSIFEELGFSLCRARRCDHPEHPYEHVRPEALTLEQVRAASPDRFELDRVVFDVLGLTDEERLEVYRAVAQLVKDRLVKARSV